MKKADYIALLSYYEGYGMVIEEAKILNKKIIITNTAATEAVNQYSNKIIFNVLIPNFIKVLISIFFKICSYDFIII